MKEKSYTQYEIFYWQEQPRDFLFLSGVYSSIIIFICSLSVTSSLHAQSDIPIGTWRMHLSYNTIKSIAIGTNEIFAASEGGILIFNAESNSLETYNTLNGLSTTGISHIAYDKTHKQLLIAYMDGTLDVLKDELVINFSRLKNSPNITGSKAISHIAIHNELAYLSTDYGMVIFDLEKLELKETWRDLGALGRSLKIFESTFRNDSIFLATEKGVIAGNLHLNLLDFNNWKRFDEGDFANPVESISTFNNKIYAAIDGLGIYQYKNGIWIKEDFLTTANFNTLSGSANDLLIAEGTKLWSLNNENILTGINTDLITTPLAVKIDAQGILWIGDAVNGLVSNTSGDYISYLPNGPTISSPFRLKFMQEKLFLFSGGYDNAGRPLKNAGVFNFLSEGIWQTSSTSVENLTDVDFKNNEMFIASFGGGIERTDVAGNATIFDAANSPLRSALQPESSVYITDLESYGDHLWVTNYSVEPSLHVLKNDNTWESFAFGIQAARYPIMLAADFDGRVWTVLDPARGGGIWVFDRENNSNIYLSDQVGSGALPSRAVRSIAVDREGSMWIGTDQGIAYFFSPRQDAIKPIFENRFLLREEKVTAIEVDGGNRKWVGTERGVWVFNATGEKSISNFTAENSPLLSNVIRDIEINDATGEVFFSTDKGILSYRTDATASDIEFTNLKIFPNPVTSDFSGTVGISGLATDAIVKITDVSGKLIWQTQANGGTASWNVRDYNGKRASTGIYIVFAVTENGGESVVGKIAVIE